MKNQVYTVAMVVSLLLTEQIACAEGRSADAG